MKHCILAVQKILIWPNFSVLKKRWLKFVVIWPRLQDVFLFSVYLLTIAAVFVFLSACLHFFYKPNIKQLTIQWVLAMEVQF